MAGKRLTVTLNPKVVDLIDECLATGLYGSSRADALRYFVIRGIEESGAIRLLKAREGEAQ